MFGDRVDVGIRDESGRRRGKIVTPCADTLRTGDVKNILHFRCCLENESSQRLWRSFYSVISRGPSLSPQNLDP